METIKRSFALGMRVLMLLFTMCLLFLGTFSIAYGGDAERSEIKYDSMNKSGMPSRPVDYEQLAFSNIDESYSSETKNIGIDTLYGLNTRIYSYHGEVPNPYSNDVGHEELKDYPHSDTYEQTNDRKWYNDPKGVNNGLAWEDDHTKDIHAVNLTEDYTFLEPVLSSLNAVMFNAITAINGLFNSIVKFEITLSNFDLRIVLDALKLKDFSNWLNQIFIRSDSGLSPLMIIAISLFILGLIPLIFNRVRSGSVSAGALFTEFGYLLLAMFVAAIALSGQVTGLTSTLSSFSSKLVSELPSTGGENNGIFKLYSYDTGDKIKDANHTQSAISNKPYIDCLIKNQFGYNVSDLDLVGKNWGVDDDQLKNIVKSLTYSGNENLFSVSTSANGSSSYTIKGFKESEKECANLGYYWYAACSFTDKDNPFSVDSEGNVTINNSSSENVGNNMRYIADFLAAVDATTDGNSKARAIMKNLNTPNYDVASMLPLMFVSILLSLALLVSVLMTLYGKLVFDIGAICVAIMPVLLLTPIKNIRSLSKQMLFSWFISCIRMLIGMAMVIVTLTFSAILCSVDYGVFIDILFLGLMFRFTPVLYKKINEAIARTSLGSGQFTPMRDIDSRFNNFIGKRQNDMGLLNNRKNYTEARNKMMSDIESFDSKEHSEVDNLNKSSGINENVESVVNNAVDEAFSNYKPEFEAAIREEIESGDLRIVGVEEIDENKLTEEDEQEIEEAKERAREALADLADEKDSDLAERLGIGTAEFREALRKQEELNEKNRIIEEAKLETMRDDLEFVASKQGRILTLIPGFTSLLKASSTARGLYNKAEVRNLNEGISLLELTGFGMDREMAKAKAELSKHSSRKKLTDSDKEMVGELFDERAADRVDLTKLLKQARVAEEDKITEDLDSNVFRIATNAAQRNAEETIEINSSTSDNNLREPTILDPHFGKNTSGLANQNIEFVNKPNNANKPETTNKNKSDSLFNFNSNRNGESTLKQSNDQSTSKSKREFKLNKPTIHETSAGEIQSQENSIDSDSRSRMVGKKNTFKFEQQQNAIKEDDQKQEQDNRPRKQRRNSRSGGSGNPMSRDNGDNGIIS